MSVVGLPQCKPPSVDLLTKTPLGISGDGEWNSRPATYTSPLGANVTHGSLVRWAIPPEAWVMLGMTTFVQWLPPSVLTPATSPRAPPLDQRSCCQMPTRCCGLVGS